MHTRTELESWQTEVQADTGTESRQGEETSGQGAQMTDSMRNEWLSSVRAQPHPWASSVQALQDGDGSASPPTAADRWNTDTLPEHQTLNPAITSGIHVFPAPLQYVATPITVEDVRRAWLAEQQGTSRVTARNLADLRQSQRAEIARPRPQNRRFRGWDRAAVEIHDSWARQEAQIAHSISDPEHTLGWVDGCGCHECHREADGWCDCRLEINNPDEPER